MKTTRMLDKITKEVLFKGINSTEVRNMKK